MSLLSLSVSPSRHFCCAIIDIFQGTSIASLATTYSIVKTTHRVSLSTSCLSGPSLRSSSCTRGVDRSYTSMLDPPGARVLGALPRSFGAVDGETESPETRYQLINIKNQVASKCGKEGLASHISDPKKALHVNMNAIRRGIPLCAISVDELQLPEQKKSANQNTYR